MSGNESTADEISHTTLCENSINFWSGIVCDPDLDMIAVSEMAAAVWIDQYINMKGNKNIN